MNGSDFMKSAPLKYITEFHLTLSTGGSRLNFTQCTFDNGQEPWEIHALGTEIAPRFSLVIMEMPYHRTINELAVTVHRLNTIQKAVAEHRSQLFKLMVPCCRCGSPLRDLWTSCLDRQPINGKKGTPAKNWRVLEDGGFEILKTVNFSVFWILLWFPHVPENLWHSNMGLPIKSNPLNRY